jgi:hypothetical protein
MTDPTVRRQRELEAGQRREQLRLAEQIEQRRQNMRRRSEPAVRDNQRLAALENEWASFKAGVKRVQREQQREAYFQDLQRMVDDLGRTFNPPPLVEQPYVPPPSEGTGRLGYSDFNPALMVQPSRWW